MTVILFVFPFTRIESPLFTICTEFASFITTALDILESLNVIILSVWGETVKTCRGQRDTSSCVEACRCSRWEKAKQVELFCLGFADIHLSLLPVGPFLCPGVVYQTEQVACSLSELQPSLKWRGFKLWTFNFDSALTLPSCDLPGPLSKTKVARRPHFWVILGKCHVYCESLPHSLQNKRWDHVWLGWFLETNERKSLQIVKGMLN